MDENTQTAPNAAANKAQDENKQQIMGDLAVQGGISNLKVVRTFHSDHDRAQKGLEKIRSEEEKKVEEEIRQLEEALHAQATQVTPEHKETVISTEPKLPKKEEAKP